VVSKQLVDVNRMTLQATIHRVQHLESLIGYVQALFSMALGSLEESIVE